MAEIVEKITFQTGDAVNSIAALDKSLKGLNTRLATFNKRANTNAGQAAVNNMNKLATGARNAQKAAGNLSRQLRTTGQVGSRAAGQISIGFAGLGKALVAREIVSALNNLKSLILESAEAAGEFEIAVARISNIADGPGSSINRLTENLAQLSVELGRPNAEVAAAAFEALQNDLGSTVDTMDLLANAANNLALVTGGDLTQAVNSISSVLKAYDLDISEAETVTDQFFAAIDKGRITLEELESSLGKVTPLAAQLNIGFDQVAAAMAAITQQGTSASVANTQLRNILAKLIRPTDALQAAFNRLGVETFQQLIERTGNFQVALQEIAGALGNNDRAIASAFNNLRGQLGVFNLLANEGKIFADTLEAVNDSAGKAAEGANRIDATNARENQRAWAEFNETLRQVGEQVLKVQTAFVKGINAILPEGEALEDLLDNIAKGAIALGTGAVIVAIVAFGSALTAALAPLLAIAGAGAVVFAGLELIDVAFNSTANNLEDIQDRLEASVNEIQKTEEEGFTEATETVKRLLGERTQAAEAYVQGMRRAFEEETAIIRQAARTAQDALDASFDDFTSGFDGIFERIKSQAKSAVDALKSARSDVRSADQELEDFLFDKDNRNITNAERFRRELSRAEQTGRDLKNQLKGDLADPANAEVAAETADKLQDQAQGLRDIAEGEANRVRKRELIQEADRLEEQALRAKVTLSETQESVAKRQLSVADSLLKKQESIKDQLNEQLEILRQQLGIQNEQGNIKTPQERQSDLELAEGTAQNIEDLFGGLDLDLLALFDEEKTLQSLGDTLNKAVAQSDVDFTNIQNALQAKLNEEEFKVFVDVALSDTGIAAIDEAVNAAAESAGDNPVARSEAARAARAELLEAQLKAQNELDAAVATLGEQRAATDAAFSEAIRSKTVSDLFSLGELQKIDTQIGLLKEQIRNPELSPEEVAAIDAQIEALKTKVSNFVDAGTISENVGTSIKAGLASLQEELSQGEGALQIEARLQEGAAEALTNELLGVKTNAADPLKTSIEGGKTALDNANTSAGNLNSSTMTLADSANTAAADYRDMAEAAQAAAEAAAAAAAAGAGSFYHGGQIPYRAIGGPISRGRDTLLAAVSPGERIINSRSSRNFSPQLQAINAGQEPPYRERGGEVTNIGDINVNVATGSEGESSGQMGRRIATELRRELRRNTSRLS